MFVHDYKDFGYKKSDNFVSRNYVYVAFFLYVADVVRHQIAVCLVSSAVALKPIYNVTHFKAE